MTAAEKKQALLIQKAEEMKRRVAEQFAAVQPERFVPVARRSEPDEMAEIGGEWFRMWTKKVQVLGWEERKKSVKVLVNGEKSTYNWPLHKLCAYHTAIHFEAEPRYMEMFGNSRKITIGSDVYIVANDKVWYMNGAPVGSHTLAVARWSEFVVGKEIKSDVPWIM